MVITQFDFEGTANLYNTRVFITIGREVAPFLLPLSASHSFNKMLAIEENSATADLVRSQLTGDQRCSVHYGDVKIVLAANLPQFSGQPIMWWIPNDNGIVAYIQSMRPEKDFFVYHVPPVREEIVITPKPLPVPPPVFGPIKEEIGLAIINTKNVEKAVLDSEPKKVKPHETKQSKAKKEDEPIDSNE